MLEATRKNLNETQLKELHPVMARKVRAVIADLESAGWLPYIVTGWRSPAEQLQKVKEGRSKVRYSFHNVTGKGGRPESLAVDIVDTRKGYDSPKEFWLTLAAAGAAHGLASGIMFGLGKRKAELLAVLKARDFKNKGVSIGWDPSHLEPAGISLLQARLGVRPK